MIMMMNPTLTLQKNPDGLSFTSQSRAFLQNSSTFPSFFQHQVDLQRFLSSTNYQKNVQNSIAARVALSPAQCARRKALPHHRATTQDFEELEELGGAMDARGWFDLLLQHLERVC